MSRLQSRKTYGPQGEKRRQQRRNKTVPGAGTTKTVTGEVTNMATSRNGDKYVTLRTEVGTHQRTQALIDNGVLGKMVGGDGPARKPRRSRKKK